MVRDKQSLRVKESLVKSVILDQSCANAVMEYMTIVGTLN